MILPQVKQLFDIEIAALATCRDRLDDNFEKAAKILALCNKVIISGVGKSGIVGRKVAATLTSVGCPAVFLHPTDALHGDLGIVQPNDAAILISNSGTTPEIQQLQSYLNNKGITEFIMIVGRKDGIGRRAGAAILDASVAEEADHLNLVPTASTTVQMALGDALAVTVLLQRGRWDFEDFAKNHPGGSIGHRLHKSAEDVMLPVDCLPILNTRMTLQTAISAMNAAPVGCCLVTDGTGELQGIITDGDLRRLVAKHSGDSLDELLLTPAIEVMTPDPTVIMPHCRVSQAIALMEKRPSQISVLPVVSETRKLVGLVRLHDLQ